MNPDYYKRKALELEALGTEDGFLEAADTWIDASRAAFDSEQKQSYKARAFEALDKAAELQA